MVSGQWNNSSNTGQKHWPATRSITTHAQSELPSDRPMKWRRRKSRFLFIFIRLEHYQFRFVSNIEQLTRPGVGQIHISDWGRQSEAHNTRTFVYDRNFHCLALLSFHSLVTCIVVEQSHITFMSFFLLKSVYISEKCCSRDIHCVFFSAVVAGKEEDIHPQGNSFLFNNLSFLWLVECS